MSMVSFLVSSRYIIFYSVALFGYHIEEPYTSPVELPSSHVWVGPHRVVSNPTVAQRFFVSVSAAAVAEPSSREVQQSQEAVLPVSPVPLPSV